MEHPVPGRQDQVTVTGEVEKVQVPKSTSRTSTPEKVVGVNEVDEGIEGAVDEVGEGCEMEHHDLVQMERLPCRIWVVIGMTLW